MSLKDRLSEFYHNVVLPNTGVSLLLVAHFFNSIMIVTCKLLETDPETKDHPIHPLQILFVRMLITYFLCLAYMLVTRSVDEAPFGPKDQRVLLVLRGILGFFGVYGLYFSLQYLSLSDAVSITFLIPMVTPFFAWIVLGERYSVLEAVCAFLSLGGVLLVAKPEFLFGPRPDTDKADDATESSSTELRLLGTGVGLIGVCGAAAVYILLRKIGKSAHPLISVSYFALTTCIVTFVSTLLLPTVSFAVPRSSYQWFLFGLIGVSGFLMQFCLTAGLQREKAGKSSLMIYSTMVYALFWDLAIWGHLPGLLSMLGTGLIVLNATIVIKYKPSAGPEPVEGDVESSPAGYHKPGDIALDDFIVTDDDESS
ncbi:uncharacterized protein CXQ87_004541 [Candidozyma duobushaemuli]|uniref:EamA domain-containing protein n=2 Tax=Candidozyma TaxID=3303203 RepID=A0ABX8IAN3_9ASCO|nr:uncharacterized protein CXQ87_004541 [[Candida] duobushaemulonis]PVH16983.1 hypothetical protein CXQ87_004541 [[Candida] duobushaemulonis]QWU89755.1 hypothetical protein CA3LBN_004103 [[Candida] haemuloni]